MLHFNHLLVSLSPLGRGRRKDGLLWLERSCCWRVWHFGFFLPKLRQWIKRCCSASKRSSGLSLWMGPWRRKNALRRMFLRRLLFINTVWGCCSWWRFFFTMVTFVSGKWRLFSQSLRFTCSILNCSFLIAKMRSGVLHLSRLEILWTTCQTICQIVLRWASMATSCRTSMVATLIVLWVLPIFDPASFLLWLWRSRCVTLILVWYWRRCIRVGCETLRKSVENWGRQ